jgi:hypothetical protein
MCLSTTSGLTLPPESFKQRASFRKRKNQAMPRAEGWFKVHRGWMENPVFKDDSERLCWLWLIEKAAWQDTHHNIHGARCDVPRGSLFITQRCIATRFKWSNSKVTRLLVRLENEGMIRYKTEAGRGHITICNYEKYQHHEGKTEAGRGQEPVHKKKNTSKKKERSSPGVSEYGSHWDRFKSLYQSVPKNNWTSKDEVVQRSFLRAVEQDGADAVLVAVELYVQDCITNSRPAYNPYNFFSKGHYKTWLNQPAKPRYEDRMFL